MTLDAIGLKHKTDKSSMTHCYLDNYEKYFESWRDKEFTLLEIGCAAGNSIRMWREYFPEANVFSIDINPDCLGYVDGVFIGSQTDMEFLDDLLNKIGVPDVIIDDGSHVGQDMIDTFKHLFPKMKSGGLYIVEDFHTAFSIHYSGELESNGRTKVFNFFSDLAAHIDVAGKGMCGSQDFCINHPSTDIQIPEFSKMLKSLHIYCSLRFLFRK